MPASRALYILPSEALDLDSLASSLVLVELWRALAAGSSREAAYIGQKLAWQQGAPESVFVLFPLQKPAELLWRPDISYLLQFLSAEQWRQGVEAKLDTLGARQLLATVEKLFGGACLWTSQWPRQLLHGAADLILLDRHHLPHDWPQDLPVRAIYDHRVDSGALPLAKWRYIAPASSCVSLLLDEASRCGLLAKLSGAALLLALGAMHLDHGHNSERPVWEEKIWQYLLERLAAQLAAGALAQLLRDLRWQRDNPGGNLWQQLNSDMKVLTIREAVAGLGEKQPGNPEKLRVAVASVTAQPLALQQLLAKNVVHSKVLTKASAVQNEGKESLAGNEKDALGLLLHSCLQRQDADFLVILHRCGSRYISFCPRPKVQRRGTMWQKLTEGDFLRRLQQRWAAQTIYKSGTEKLPRLTQWQQSDPSQRRKDFIPALQQCLQELFT